MKRPWIRVYTDLPDNAKVQALPGDLFKLWTNLICVFGGQNEVGQESVGLRSDTSLAWRLHMKPSYLESGFKKLVAAKLLDRRGSAYFPHDWSEHQRSSDVSNERVKRFRERERNVTGHVTNLLPEQSRAENRTETRAEQKQKPLPRDLTMEEFKRLDEEKRKARLLAPDASQSLLPAAALAANPLLAQVDPADLPKVTNELAAAASRINGAKDPAAYAASVIRSTGRVHKPAKKADKSTDRVTDILSRI